jgi:hypothetical protein
LSLTAPLPIASANSVTTDKKTVNDSKKCTCREQNVSQWNEFTEREAALRQV